MGKEVWLMMLSCADFPHVCIPALSTKVADKYARGLLLLCKCLQGPLIIQQKMLPYQVDFTIHISQSAILPKSSGLRFSGRLS
jgi:hypothetical protein